jgi:hypothetical protein
MTRIALLVLAYWLIALISYEGVLWLAEHSEKRVVYALVTMFSALVLFGAHARLLPRDLPAIFAAALLAAAGFLALNIAPLHDVDPLSTSLERLNYLFPWLLIFFVPAVIGAGLRRLFTRAWPQ